MIYSVMAYTLVFVYSVNLVITYLIVLYTFNTVGPFRSVTTTQPHTAPEEILMDDCGEETYNHFGKLFEWWTVVSISS